MTDTNGNGNIVEKIRKMLRLARDKGATEAEAAAALSMANRLMLQHNIESVEESVEEIAIRGDWRDFEVDKKWQQILVSAVGTLYNCRSLLLGGKRVQFIGKPSNVLVAADTLAWVIEQVDALHKQALRTFREEKELRNGEPTKLTKFEYRDFRLTFKEACALRIFRRVNEIVAAMRNEIPAHMALVVIDQALAAADDIISGMGIKKPSKGIKLRRSGHGTGAGWAAGDKVQLQHKVNK